MGLETIAAVGALGFGAFNTIKSLTAKPPKVQSSAPADVTAAAKSDKARQSALFETQGGISGQELAPDEVGKRNTLLGN